MLDLKTGVHLHEVEVLVVSDKELDRTGVQIAGRAHGLERRLVHAGARLDRQEGRRPLLHQLLVAALHRALAIAQHQRAAAPVAEHLHLDVVRVDDRLLEVQAGIAERGARLGRRGVEEPLELVRVLDEAHAAPSPARRGLEQHRIAGGLGDARGLGRGREPAGRAGNQRQPGGAHRVLRAGLVAEHLHRLGRRPDERDVVVEAGAHEGGVLAEEAVAGMHGVAAGRDRGGDHARDLEVALGRRGRPDADGAIGRRHPGSRAIGRRVDRDRLDAELVARADHAHGDLAPVRYEHAAEQLRRSRRARTGAGRTRPDRRCARRSA